MNSSPILYADSIKYLGFIFTSNNCDDSDILKQMRMLYCKSNRLVRLFNKCSKPVLLELCKSFCTVFYCPYFWTQYKKTTFSKIRVVYETCDIDMYVCFYMVSVTITLEIFKIRYYVKYYMYYALFDSLSKLLLYLSHKCYV